jgi:hypothetical protein
LDFVYEFNGWGPPKRWLIRGAATSTVGTYAGTTRIAYLAAPRLFSSL